MSDTYVDPGPVVRRTLPARPPSPPPATLHPADLLDAAQRAMDERPHDPAAHQRVQRSVLLHLNGDAFCAFVAETDRTYIINFRGARPIVVPKVHTAPELYPPDKRTPAERVFGLTWWALLGLIPAGLGALVLSPVIVTRAAGLLGKLGMSRRDYRLTTLSILLALGLGLLGLGLAFVLFLHISP